MFWKKMYSTYCNRYSKLSYLNSKKQYQKNKKSLASGYTMMYSLLVGIQ